MSGNDNFSNLTFGKRFYCPGTSFHPAKSTRNGPKLSEGLKIDEFQKNTENPKQFSEAFLNKSLIKISQKNLTSEWSKISNFADIPKLFFRRCQNCSGVLKIAWRF